MHPPPAGPATERKSSGPTLCCWYGLAQVHALHQQQGMQAVPGALRLDNQHLQSQ